MNTVVLRVETELDPSAAPRVFGYLGGLGHIPMRAALRRGGDEALVMEVQFETSAAAAHLISAKVGQMPFVLSTHLANGAGNSGGGAEPKEPVAPSGHSSNVTDGGMQHAPFFGVPCRPRLDVTALCFAAAQRGRAVHHRSVLQFNA